MGVTHPSTSLHDARGMSIGRCARSLVTRVGLLYMALERSLCSQAYKTISPLREGLCFPAPGARWEYHPCFQLSPRSVVGQRGHPSQKRRASAKLFALGKSRWRPTVRGSGSAPLFPCCTARTLPQREQVVVGRRQTLGAGLTSGF